jgi:hypothetical protein
MTAGAARPLPVQFLWSSAVLDTLAALPARCDVLLINGPPLGGGGDALWIAGHAEGLLLVASVHTKRAQVSEARRILEGSPTRKLGLLATRQANHFTRLRSRFEPALKSAAEEERGPETLGPRGSDDSSEHEDARRVTLIEQGSEVTLRRSHGASSSAGP